MRKDVRILNTLSYVGIIRIRYMGLCLWRHTLSLSDRMVMKLPFQSIDIIHHIHCFVKWGTKFSVRHIIQYKQVIELLNIKGGTTMHHSLSLNNIAIGESAVVLRLTSHGSMRRRLLDIGLVEGALVTCIGAAPSGDPRAYLIRGAVIAIRQTDCNDIIVSRADH